MMTLGFTHPRVLASPHGRWTAPVVPLLISSHGRTDRGRVRAHNEDVFLDDPAGRLWVVADGMGGHAAGDVASQAVVRHLQEVGRRANAGDYIDAIDDALAAANAELVDYAVRNGLDVVGTTVVVLLDAGTYFLCGWAGDSRAYHMAGGSLRQLSKDHVHERPASRSSQVSPADALAHAHSGALLRAVGASQDLVVEWRVVEVAPHDVLLLCSDGITKELTDADIGAVLARSAPADEMANELVAASLAHGGRDNITVVVVRVDG